MKIVQLIFLSSLFSLLWSCEPDDSSREPYRISGYLYESCNKEPYANLTLTCTCWGGGNFVRSNELKQLGSFTTDENGYFDFTFKDCENGDTFLAKDLNGSEAFTYRNSGLVRDLYMVRYNRPKSWHTAILKTDSTYGPNDTIFVSAGGHFGEVLAQFNGPFVNNEVHFIDSTRINFVRGEYLSFEENLEPDLVMYWGLGRLQFDSIRANGSGRERHVMLVKQIICGLGDTAVVDIRGYRK